MRKLYITIGISGSGKSTYIKKNYNTSNCLIIETDAIREELCGKASDQSKNKEVFILPRDRFRHWLSIPNSEQDTCVIDATNLTVKERNNWYNIIQDEYQMELGIDISITLIVFKNITEKAFMQNKIRSRQVPNYVIEKQSAKYTAPNIWESYNCAIVEVE